MYTIEYSIPIDIEEIFFIVSNTAFTDKSLTHKSTGRFLYKLFRGSADWYSAKQKTITTSSIEAELLALIYTTKEMIWWH